MTINTRIAELVTPASWITDLKRQLERRKHILLCGQIHDLFVHDNRYQSLDAILRDVLCGLGFSVVVECDAIGPVRFADEIPSEMGDDGAEEPRPGEFYSTGGTGMRTLFETCTGRRSRGRRPMTLRPDILSGQSVRDRPSASPSNQLDSDTAECTNDIPFAQLPVALRQRETSIAAVINFSDMLTASASQYSTEDREVLVQLQKCIVNARIAKRHRNTVIMKASSLARTPEWLHANNPHIAIVRVDIPTRKERHQYALGYSRPDDANPRSKFNGASNIDDREQFATIFADLTDGFTAMDLEGLRLTSWSQKIPVASAVHGVSTENLKKVVDYYKFGTTEDPWEALSPEKLQSAETELTSGAYRVVGQDKAVQSVVSMLKSARVGISMTDTGQGSKPKGVFFFVGPTGVGKTELAKAVANLVFSDPNAVIRFDMSEFGEEHSAERLTGSPPGYVGYSEGGQLTRSVIQRPHSILLFDEIEKAHPRVMDKFLQILDEGRLTDGQGQTAYFNHTVVIFTSNTGVIGKHYEKSGERAWLPGFNELLQKYHVRTAENAGGMPPYEVVEDHFKSAVEVWLTHDIKRAELRGRLGDNIVVFDALRPAIIPLIVQKFQEKLKRSAEEKYRLDLVFDDSITDFLTKAMMREENSTYGGRRVKKLMETLVETPLNEWIYDNCLGAPGRLTVGISAQGKLDPVLVDFAMPPTPKRVDA